MLLKEKRTPLGRVFLSIETFTDEMGFEKYTETFQPYGRDLSVCEQMKVVVIQLPINPPKAKSDG